jgi:hypothetical protein
MSLIRSAALNVIKSIIPLNLPSSQIISVLINFGLSYNRQSMLEDIRTANGRVKYQSQIENLSSNQVVPESWMTSEKLGAPYEYRVHFKVSYYDNETAEYVNTYRYMFSDDYASVGNWEDQYPGYSDPSNYSPGYEFMGAKVMGVAKNTW